MKWLPRSESSLSHKCLRLELCLLVVHCLGLFTVQDSSCYWTRVTLHVYSGAKADLRCNNGKPAFQNKMPWLFKMKLLLLVLVLLSSDVIMKQMKLMFISVLLIKMFHSIWIILSGSVLLRMWSHSARTEAHTCFYGKNSWNFSRIFLCLRFSAGCTWSCLSTEIKC